MEVVRVPVGMEGAKRPRLPVLAIETEARQLLGKEGGKVGCLKDLLLVHRRPPGLATLTGFDATAFQGGHDFRQAEAAEFPPLDRGEFPRQGFLINGVCGDLQDCADFFGGVEGFIESSDGRGGRSFDEGLFLFL